MSPPTPLTTTRSVRMRSRLGSAARSSSRNPTHRYLPAPPASPPTHTGPPAPLVQHPHPYPRPPVAGVACGGPPVAGVACGGVGGAGASQARDACGRQRDWEQTAAIAPLRAPRHARTRSTDSPYRFPVGARGRPRSQRRGLARVPLSRSRLACPCRLPVARLLVTYRQVALGTRRWSPTHARRSGPHRSRNPAALSSGARLTAPLSSALDACRLAAATARRGSQGADVVSPQQRYTSRLHNAEEFDHNLTII